MLGCTAPDFAKKFILQTDACNDGVGGVLFQEEAGVKHAVALASKKLLAREKKLLNNWKGVFSYCLGCTEVSKLSVWEAICIRNRPSATPVSRQGSISEWSFDEMGVTLTALSIHD